MKLRSKKSVSNQQILKIRTGFATLTGNPRESKETQVFVKYKSKAWATVPPRGDETAHDKLTISRVVRARV